jgi:hypothetical protein
VRVRRGLLRICTSVILLLGKMQRVVEPLEQLPVPFLISYLGNKMMYRCAMMVTSRNHFHFHSTSRRGTKIMFFLFFRYTSTITSLYIILINFNSIWINILSSFSTFDPICINLVLGRSDKHRCSWWFRFPIPITISHIPLHGCHWVRGVFGSLLGCFCWFLGSFCGCCCLCGDEGVFGVERSLDSSLDT